MNGFYNINLEDREPFQWGKITDVKTGKTVCPGEICPLVLPESDPNIPELIKDCLWYTPLHRGTKLRIFWDEYHNRFNVSTDTCIYPTPVILSNGKEGLDLSSVNFAKLDKTKCYYVYSEHGSNRIVLLTEVDREKEIFTLKLPPVSIEEIDSNFTYNTRLYEIGNKDRLVATQQTYDGFAYYFGDGHYIEVRTQDYYDWMTMKKPAHIGFQMWYRHLQKEGQVDDYLHHFPEHNYIFTQLKKND